MKNKKTMHELAKEFPNKTYRELEKYRNADRQEEAQQIITQQENEELTESQQKQEELEPIAKGVCITAAMKQDRGEGLKLTEILAIENDKLKKETRELLTELTETKVLLKGKKGNIYNIGGDKEFSNIYIIKKICRILDQIEPRKNKNK